jgi:hypothetical protein
MALLALKRNIRNVFTCVGSTAIPRVVSSLLIFLSKHFYFHWYMYSGNLHRQEISKVSWTANLFTNHLFYFEFLRDKFLLTWTQFDRNIQHVHERKACSISSFDHSHKLTYTPTARLSESIRCLLSNELTDREVVYASLTLSPSLSRTDKMLLLFSTMHSSGLLCIAVQPVQPAAVLCCAVLCCALLLLLLSMSVVWCSLLWFISSNN